MKNLVLILLAVLISCGNKKTITGKWINTSVRNEKDVGSVNFEDDLIILKLADGTIMKPLQADLERRILFQLDRGVQGYGLCRIIEKSDQQILIEEEVGNQRDTMRLLTYNTFERSDLSPFDLGRIMAEKLWKGSLDSSSTFQFLHDSTVIQWSRHGDNEGHYRFRWQILHFDSLLLLRTISIFPDVSFVNVKSEAEIELWSPQKDLTVKLVTSPVTSIKDSVSSHLTGSWRASRTTGYRAAPYQSIQFDQVLNSRLLSVTEDSGFNRQGEWEVDLTGHIAILDLYSDRRPREIMIKKLGDISVFCIDGFCYEYRRE